MIDGQKLFDQPAKNNLRAHNSVQKKFNRSRG